MQWLALPAFLLVLASSLLAQPAADFLVHSEYIRVPVQVLDPEGRLLPDLGKNHFQLFDGDELRTIRNFLPDHSPVDALLLLDVSNSLPEEISAIRQSALQFARALKTGDRVAVMTFSDHHDLLQNWTTNLRSLPRSLKRLRRGYRTALYDSLLAVSTDQFDASVGRKVILLLTDGLDNSSRAGPDEVQAQLAQSGISLYIISRTRLVQPQVQKSRRVLFMNAVMKKVLGDPKDFVELYFRKREATLIRLAESTGGRVFFPETLASLETLYGNLALELGNRYLLTFRPPVSSQKRLRTIRLLCSAPAAERLYYRKLYLWKPPERP